MRDNKILSKIMALVLTVAMMAQGLAITVTAEGIAEGMPTVPIVTSATTPETPKTPQTPQAPEIPQTLQAPREPQIPAASSYDITAFAPLDETTARQYYAPGTAQSSLNLPESLTATAAESESGEESQAVITVSQWVSSPAYDPDTKGDYVFSPELSLPNGYSLADTITLPSVTVTIKELQGFNMAAAITIGSQSDWDTRNGEITLNNGDTLTITTTQSPTIPTAIIIEGTSATIKQTSSVVLNNIYIVVKDTNTALTLENLKLTAPTVTRGILLNGTGAKTLTITGSVSITGSSDFDAIYSSGYLTIDGTGTLNAVGGDGSIYSGNGIAVSAGVGSGITISASVTAIGGNGGYGGSGINSGAGDIIISDAVEVEAKGGTGTTPGPDFYLYSNKAIKVTASGATLSGSGRNFQAAIDVASAATSLTLKKITMTAPTGTSGVVLNGTDANTLTITDNVSITGSGGYDAIYSKGNLTINGKGALNAVGGDGTSGNGGNGISGTVINISISAKTTAKGGDSTSGSGGSGITKSGSGNITITAQTTAAGGNGGMYGGYGIVSGYGDIIISAPVAVEAKGGTGTTPGGDFAVISPYAIKVNASGATISGSGESFNATIESADTVTSLTLKKITMTALMETPGVVLNGTSTKTLTITDNVSIIGGSGGNAIFSLGSLTISGKGTLNAVGGNNTAGMGGNGIAVVNNGIITINAKTTAMGGNGGGLGSGGSGIYGGAVTIASTAAPVTATGGSVVNGTGSGGDGIATNGDITISGTLTATGGNSAADNGGFGIYSATGAVTINASAAKVTAKGGDAATAATYNGGFGIYAGKNLTILSELEATGGSANGGMGGKGIYTNDGITVSAKLTATGGSASGTGRGENGAESDGTITINQNATVTAKGGDAVVGQGGHGLAAYFSTDWQTISFADITVYGKLTATGGNSAAGNGGHGIIGYGDITIDNVIAARGGTKGFGIPEGDGVGIVLVDMALIEIISGVANKSGKLMLTNKSKGSVIASGGATTADIVANYITLPKGSSYTLNGVDEIGSTPSPIKVIYLDAETTPSGGGGGGGGSSSSGGGGSTTTVITGNVNDQSVNITVTTTDGNKTASAAVSASDTQKAIEAAAAAAEKSGEAPNVAITIPAESGKIDAQTSVSATIPAAAMAAVANSENTSLTLNTPAVTLTFDSAAVQTIAGAADSGDVTINANITDTTTLSEAQQEQIGGRPVYEFTVTADGKPVTDFNGTVEVSIPYTPKAGENPNAIVIYFIGADGTLNCVENGSYDPATGKVSFTTNHFSLYMIGYNPVTFNDIPETYWGKAAIEKSAARGLVAGVGGGKYDPDRAVTRAEFVQMVQNVLKLPSGSGTAGYADVASGAWYYNAVISAKSAGLLEGLTATGNSFMPNQPITREEMAVILANIAAYKKAAAKAFDLSKFSDIDAIENSYREKLETAIALGLLNKDGVGGGRFDPKGVATRAQAAQIQMNLLNIF